MTPRLSVIIPACNEERRLGPTLQQVCSYCARQGQPFEILVVDDGSTDGTADIARRAAAGHPELRLLRNERNMGKGYAVKRGMLEAHGEYRLFTDADLSAPIEEVEKLLPWLEQGYDIAIGSRSVPGSNVVSHQPAYRETMGRVFNRLVRSAILDGIIDTQCGFKCFRGDSAQTIFARQTLTGFCFDVEVLYIGKQLGCRIREVPVTWSHCAETRVNLVTDSLRMLRDLLTIRRRHRG